MRPRRAAVIATAAMGLAVTAGGPHGRAAAQGPPALPRITFSAGPGGSFLVHGTHPAVSSECVRPVQPVLHERYAGTIEVGRDADGQLFLIGELPVEWYLEGIAEMPRSWPLAALKAQAVAARTYALAHLAFPDPTGEALGYDLCATDACQVYRGLGVANGPDGERWRTAVEATAGRVLLSGDRPADTVYFSTSDGHTYGNEDVFGSAPLPYLRPVQERDDSASPLSHWRSKVSLPDLGRFLQAAGRWPEGRAVTTVRRSGSEVRMSGRNISRTLAVPEFRSTLNTWAHCLEPDRYPGVDTDGSRLPQTVPSIWFDVSTTGKDVVLAGRGWGHGVGMVQWGAYGKARRGMGYRDILAAYYGGLRPSRYVEPATIRIGVATGLASVSVVPRGPFTVQGRSLPPGPWLITGGQRLRVTRTEPPAPSIGAGALSLPARTRSGSRRTATLQLPQTSVASLVLAVPGEDLPLTDPVTLPAGTSVIRWTAPAIPPGTYRVRAVVSDGTDLVRTPPSSVRFSGGPPPRAGPTPTGTPPASPSPPAPTPTDRRSGQTGWPVLLAMALGAVALAVLSILYLARRFRREIHRDRPPRDPFGPA